MAEGLPGGMLGSLAGMAHRTATVNDRLTSAQNKVSSLPSNAPADQAQSANRNLSSAQFASTANNVRNAATIASSVQPSDSSMPDVSDPGWSGPSNVGNLYT